MPLPSDTRTWQNFPERQVRLPERSREYVTPSFPGKLGVQSSAYNSIHSNLQRIQGKSLGKAWEKPRIPVFCPQRFRRFQFNSGGSVSAAAAAALAAGRWNFPLKSSACCCCPHCRCWGARTKSLNFGRWTKGSVKFLQPGV